MRQARYVLHNKTSAVTDTILHDDASHALDAFRYGAWWQETLNPARQDAVDDHQWEQDRRERERMYG